MSRRYTCAPKGDGPDAPHDQPDKTFTKLQSDSIKAACFLGTENPRMIRVINGLLARSLSREAIDSIAGVSDGPDSISELRDLFVPKSDNRNAYIDCTRVHSIDRDGRTCHPGVYSLAALGRRLIHQWLAARSKQGVSSL